VTFFPDYTAKTKAEESLDLETLAERIQRTTAPSKDALPWLKFARFGRLPNPNGKSGSLRWSGNVARLSGVVADYDGEVITPEDAGERLDKAGIIAIVYTSPSHLLDGHGPRWRVGCPFMHEMTPDHHYRMVSRLNGLFDGKLAPESFVLAQSYYFGAVGDNPEHRAIVVDGTQYLDQADGLDEIALGKPNGHSGGAHPSGNPEAPLGDISAALDLIPNDDLDWNEWNNIGMATWRASGGSQEGFAPFDGFSQKSKKYDPDETEFRWHHYFTSPPNSIGFGSLVYLARQVKPEWIPPSKRRRENTDERVITVESGKRHIAANQGIDALVAAEVPFYQRDNKIQRIALVKAKTASGEDMMVPGIVSVDTAILGRSLGGAARWQRFDARMKRYNRIDPPELVVRQIHSMVGEWPFPPLRGIIQCPTLRRDGSLLDAEGYDEATGLIFTGNAPMPPIPANPTRQEALQALTLLHNLLAEFPFIDRESKAVALSMIITPVVRGAMTVAPMHLVTAPVAGSGKSYLQDIAAMIATGEICPVKAAAPNYEETEKRLVGSALTGSPIIALDNVTNLLAGDFLCQIVERPLLEVRALGKSPPHRIPNAFTIFGNGNNVQVAEDMVRRTIRSSLDANMEFPEDRTFRGNPVATIRHDRGRYIAAALTIPLAYIAARCPNRRPSLPSFEDWSGLVRDPLIWLGSGDPVDTQKQLRAADPQKADLAAVFQVWKTELGVGSERSVRTDELIDAANHRPILLAALTKVASPRFSRDQQIDPTVLGKWLSKHEGNIAADVKLIADRSNKARPRWYLDYLANRGPMG